MSWITPAHVNEVDQHECLANVAHYCCTASFRRLQQLYQSSPSYDTLFSSSTCANAASRVPCIQCWVVPSFWTIRYQCIGSVAVLKLHLSNTTHPVLLVVGMVHEICRYGSQPQCAITTDRRSSSARWMWSAGQKRYYSSNPSLCVCSSTNASSASAYRRPLLSLHNSHDFLCMPWFSWWTGILTLDSRATCACTQM